MKRTSRPSSGPFGRGSWKEPAGLVFFTMLVAATDAPSYRFHRKIEVQPGWCELEVPDEVFEAARPGLADVRISLTPGGELPYGKSGALPPSTLRIPLVDVERASSQETTALADRGANPGWADVAELDVDESEFIKPVTIEASSDRTSWSQIARGSIFATQSGTRMTRLRFAPNDRRYWRFRFDDKNSRPIGAMHVAVGQSTEERARRTLPIALKEESDADLAVSTYAMGLPSANLPVVAIRIHASDAAFVRRARVFERVWFRDEVSRRLLGEGEIARAADGKETTTLAVSEPTSKSIELDIERSSGVPLHAVTAEIVVEPRWLRFHVPEGSVPELVYGSSVVPPALYDISAALQNGRPSSFKKAKLGPIVDEGSTGPALSEIVRGSAVKVASWKTEQPIVLPLRGPIAYLDLERGGGALRDLRIVDQAARQIPYIVEAEPRHKRLPLAFRTEPSPGETVLHLDGVDAEKELEAIELEASSPDYFARDVRIVEQLFDARGKTDPRPIGAARWVKTAGQPPLPLRVPFTRPTGPHITVHVVDGDNAPLTISSVAADVTRRRLNFVFAAGDELRLLSGSDSVSAPNYDLALIAERVLSAPAEPAALGPARAIVAPPKSTPAWFWVFVFAAAVVLLVALARTLKTAT